jgi:nickel-type superoxide dismutase maturation protease
MKEKILSLLDLINPILKFRIQEESMTPKYNPNDLILVNKIAYQFKNPRIGDEIAFKRPGGKVYFKKITKIKSKGYFVEGLNKKQSIDSRHFGLVKKEDIIGKVLYKIG